jgi:hypothetical protein
VIVKGKEYFCHPGIRAARQPSVIWALGEEYERDGKKHWRCGVCKKNKMLAIDSGTSSTLRHLKKKHNIDNKGRRIQTKQKPIIEAFTSGARAAATTVAQVATRFNANTFRYLLIRWIVTMHIALTCVESVAFRDWILYVAPALEVYLVKTGDTIRKWILWEFAKQRRYIRSELISA